VRAGQMIVSEVYETSNGAATPVDDDDDSDFSLALQAVFDLESGFLLVAKGPRLGEDALGARGFSGPGYEVFPKRVASRGTIGAAEAPAPGFFYPKEGDRILSLNYESFRVPAAWLGDHPPPGPES